MSILAQGTQFFVIDPNLDSNGPGVLEIDYITAFNPGGNPSDQIEDTCLKYNSRTYKKGLRTPGQANGTLNADPENDSHYRFWQFAEDPEFDQVEMDMVIGWSDGPLDQSGEPISIPTVAVMAASICPPIAPGIVSGATCLTSRSISRVTPWLLRTSPFSGLAAVTGSERRFKHAAEYFKSCNDRCLHGCASGKGNHMEARRYGNHRYRLREASVVQHRCF